MTDSFTCIFAHKHAVRKRQLACYSYSWT